MLATLANIDSNFSSLFSHARQYTHSNILLSSTQFAGRSMYSIVIYSLKQSSLLSEAITMEPREIKGLEIAAKSKVIRKGKSNLWLVPSQAGREEKYTVAMHEEKPECTCRDFEFRAAKCKHIFAVEYTIQREQTADGATITTETAKITRKTYPQESFCPKSQVNAGLRFERIRITWRSVLSRPNDAEYESFSGCFLDHAH